ncbi:MAG: helix-turn-helix domain-containing protein [Planctomycetota bacterium]
MSHADRKRFELLKASLAVDVGNLAKIVLVALWDHADADGKAWPTEATIAREIGKSERSARRGISELRRKGIVHVSRPTGDLLARLLKTNRRDRLPNVYNLNGGTILSGRRVLRGDRIGKNGGSNLSCRTPIVNTHVGASSQSDSARLFETGEIQNTAHRENNSPERPSKRRRVANSPDTRVSEFIERWRELFERHKGTPWVDASPGKDRATVKRLLVQLDRDRADGDALELLAAAAEKLFRDGLRWAKGPPSVGLLAKAINELLPKPTVEKRESRQVHPVIALVAKRFPDDVDSNSAQYSEIARLVDDGVIIVAKVKSELSEAPDGPSVRAALLQRMKVEAANE